MVHVHLIPVYFIVYDFAAFNSQGAPQFCTLLPVQCG